MQNQVVDREEWLSARAELLIKEKEHTHARAALAEARRQMPWVKLQKEYFLVGADGEVPLSDVFSDRSQLAITTSCLVPDGILCVLVVPNGRTR